MAVILNIETSASTCSVALTADGIILHHIEDFEGRNHAALLSDFIKSCLDHLKQHDMKLNAIAVSIGPGSYTGLRIGLSEAKGLAYALDIPVIPVKTLKLLATSVMFKDMDIAEDTIFVPMVDARRMEVYTCAYDLSLQPLMQPCPLILDDDSYRDIIATGRPVLFFGNGSDKAAGLINGAWNTRGNCRHIPGILPLATDMLALSEMEYRKGDFHDMAYIVPEYLKEFQATKPKNSVLNQ